MKAKMSYKSKKIAIITAVIVLLIVAISTGAYFFIKGNDDTQAAYTGNEQTLASSNNGESETGENEAAGNQEEQTNPAEDQENEEQNQNDVDSQEPTNVDDNTDDDTTTDDTETTLGTTTGGNNNVTTNDDEDNHDGNIPNEEYTQTDIVETEVERIDQEVRVGWSNMALASAGMSTNITTSRPNLTTNKTAKVINSLNESDNAIQVGSKIKYEVTVTNNSQDVDATGVNVSDVIPSGTVLDTESEISNNGIESNGRVTWVIDVARNSSVTVSFTVVVKDANGEITNTAIVDGKDTPEVTNPVIKTNKTSTSEDEVLKAGSTVVYTISVENIGKATGTTTVEDKVPVGTTLVENSIEGNENYTIKEVEGQKVITWNNVEIAAGEKVELKFAVTINKFKGENIEIENTAVVGDKETNTDTEKVYNPILSIEKKADKNKVAEGDIITYTITVKNTGKVDGLATIRDTLQSGITFEPGSIKINGESSYSLNGETIDLSTKTETDLANGIQVNVEKENGVVELSFKVKVNENIKLTDKISNTAYLIDENGKETPTDPSETDVEAHIVFVENGGSDVNDIDGVAGEKIDNRNMPTTTKLGYTFEGWYAEAALTNKVEKLPENMVSGTTYYYAKWEKDESQVNKLVYTVNHIKVTGEKEEIVKTNTYTEDVYVLDEQKITIQKGTLETLTIEGYKLDETRKPAEKEGDKVENNTTINFYYVKDESQVNKLTYTVNHIKVTGEKEEVVKTNTYTEDVYVLDEQKITIQKGTLETLTIEGYKLDETRIPAEKEGDKVENNTIINFYYIARTDTAYKVEHYLEDLDGKGYTLEDTDNLTGTTGTKTEATAKNYKGFTAQPFEQEIIAGNGSTVIEIYYNRNNYKYQIRYHYENEEGTFKENTTIRKTFEAKYGEVITSYKDENANGYEFSHVTPTDKENKVHLKIVAEDNIKDNVINVYYTRKAYDYKVEYYKDNTDSVNKLGETLTSEEKYGTAMTEDLVEEDYGSNWINEYQPDGYKAGEVQEYITIQDNDNNVIRVVYSKRTDIEYTVKYYFNNVEDTEKEYTNTATFGEKIENVTDYSNNGEWSIDKDKSTALPYTIVATGNIIKVYYVKPDIKVAKSENRDVVEYGDKITYTITATNEGYKEGTVKIADSIPEGTKLASSINATGFNNVTEAQLKEGITLTVPAKTSKGNGTAKVEFTVQVVAKPGAKVDNVATVNDNDETNKVTNKVEKTITVNQKSEEVTIKNSNIVIVLDTSGSMDENSSELKECPGGFFHSHYLSGCQNIDGVWYTNKSRLEVAKEVTNNFIDKAFETAGNTVSVVEFNYGYNASAIGSATNASEASSLKREVNGLNAGGGTVMSSALKVAKNEINELKALKPDNQNIVIFVSDGEPDGDSTKSIKDAATDLKKVATVYTVAFDSNISILKDTIATDASKYYTTANSDSLGDIFTDIGQDFTDNKKEIQSNAGRVELSNVLADKDHPIIIYVNGVKADTITSLPTNTTGKVIYENGKYYIDLTKFEAADKIEIEYCTNK